MKRPPKAGEPKITHITTNTGDSQEFALGYDNYAPVAVDIAETMMDTGTPVAGFTLKRESATSFSISHTDKQISRNTVRLEGQDIVLTTELVDNFWNQKPDTLQMAADLEQCAAIGMVQKKGQAAMSDPNIEVVLTDEKVLHCFKVIYHIQIENHPEREPLEIYLHATQAFDLFHKLGVVLMEYFAQTSAELLRKLFVNRESRTLLEETFDLLQRHLASDQREPAELIAQVQKVGAFIGVTSALKVKE